MISTSYRSALTDLKEVEPAGFDRFRNGDDGVFGATPAAQGMPSVAGKVRAGWFQRPDPEG